MLCCTEELIIPDGSYEINELERYLQENLIRTGINISLMANKSTLRCEIICSEVIDFEKEGSIHEILGFERKKLAASEKHFSDHPIRISEINSFGIICIIIDGAYTNGQKSNLIHKFFPTVRPGYKIV